MLLDTRSRAVTRVAGCLVAALAFLTYLPALWNDFVDWDDPVYVTGNPHVAAGLTANSVRYALTTFDSHNWIPLTWLSYELDASLFGLNPAAFHAVNVSWHTLNVWLLYCVLTRWTGSLYRSAIVAALFAVHPMHVESVAWVSERKDLLSTCGLLLSLLAYQSYASRPTWPRYALVAVLMALGLLAKSMLVTLPVLLCLVDIWPLNRVRWRADPDPATGDVRRSPWWLLVEKIPLVVLALTDGLVTVAAQQTAMTGAAILPFQARLANAVDAYRWYLSKTFWPTGLCAFYQHPLGSLSASAVWGSAALLVGLTAYVALRGRHHRDMVLGWGWFVISLLPVIGLIQVGTQAYADRYLYIPHIGLFILVVWELHRILQRWPAGQWVGIVLACVATGACVTLTTSQIRTWRDPASLWGRALELNRYNAIAHLQLGRIALAKQDWDAAEEHFTDVMVERPSDPDAILSLGFLHQQRQEWDLAAEYYSWLLRLSPRHSAATHNLSLLPARELKPAVPTPPAVREKLQLGLRHARRGEFESALRLFQEAADVDPPDVASQNYTATALEELNRLDEASRYYARALRANPLDVEARHGLDRIGKRRENR
jgi:Tfp pilus assembly protein PilF